MNKSLAVFIAVFLCTVNVFAQKESFKVIPLGIKGGLDESNLSAYLVAAGDTDAYVSFDAGTLYAGIEKAISNGLFPGKKTTEVLKQHIKGYCISHAHLDHLSGLIINSPDDTAKNIYGMNYCLDVLKNNYFTWKSWANFADAGEQPTLNKYHYITLEEEKEIPLQGTGMFVTAFSLSHGKPYESTAFLVRNADNYLLYLGDTGADTIEHSQKLATLWKRVAPLVKAKQLKAIFIEVSYSNAQPLNKLFGHLTPALLTNELAVLATMAGSNAVKGLNVVVTHIKPAANIEATIQKELTAQNSVGVNFLFPEQGKLMRF